MFHTHILKWGIVSTFKYSFINLLIPAAICVPFVE
jgi:hypothetical protein